MQPLPPPEERSPGNPARQPRVPLARGIARAAGEMNPYLAILAIGLAVLDFTCFAGFAMTRQPSLFTPASQEVSAPAQVANPPAAAPAERHR